jgi:hypothetical protein
MTDDEALQISRQAAQDARKRVGVDKEGIRGSKRDGLSIG